MTKKKKRPTMAEKAAKLAQGPEPEPASIQSLRRELRSVYKRLRVRDGSTEIVTAVLEDILRDMPPPVAPPKPRASRKQRKEYALLHLSDWQTGANSHSFNVDILREMIVDKMLPKIRKIIDGRRSSAKLDEIVVVLGGDQVDGSGMRSNHPWEVSEDVMQQATETAPQLTCSVIMDLMSYFPNVRVNAIHGNHGRSGPLKADPNPSRVNWDTVASKSAKMMLGPLVDDKRLSFHVEEDDFMHVFKIGGCRVMSVHGHQFRGGGGFAGIPLYSIARLVAKWALSLPDHEQFDIVIMGHFHQTVQWTFGPKQIYINGSPQTGSPFVKEVIGAENWPAQRLMIFNDDFHYPIADHILYL